MRDCHSIVGLYTYQNRVPFAPSLRWVSCKERDRLPHEGANFHSSFVHYQRLQVAKFYRQGWDTVRKQALRRVKQEISEEAYKHLQGVRWALRKKKEESTDEEK